MGLDIVAYSRLTAMGEHDKDPDLNEGERGGPQDWCYYDAHVMAYAYDCFPLSFLGLPVLRAGGEFIYGGCYALTPDTRKVSFQAGSYGGYNRWRDLLAEEYNPQRRESEPFYELINFADNEGCIGPVAAMNLLADFDAVGIPRHCDVLAGPFHDFQEACRLAADGGLIDFH